MDLLDTLGKENTTLEVKLHVHPHTVVLIISSHHSAFDTRFTDLASHRDPNLIYGAKPLHIKHL